MASSDKKRLLIASSVVWFILLLPISYFMPGSDDSGIRIFWFFIWAYPVWATIGWQWVSNKPRTYHPVVGVSIVVIGLITSIVFSKEHKLEQVSFIPLLSSGLFVYFLEISGQSKLLQIIHRWYKMAWPKIGKWAVLLLIVFVANTIANIAKNSSSAIVFQLGSLIFMLWWGLYTVYKKKWLSRGKILLLTVALTIAAIAGIIKVHEVMLVAEREAAKQEQAYWDELRTLERKRELREECSNLKRTAPSIFEFREDCAQFEN